MCKRLNYLVCAVAALIMAAAVPAGAAVPIPVGNFSFEEPALLHLRGSVCG